MQDFIMLDRQLKQALASCKQATAAIESYFDMRQQLALFILGADQPGSPHSTETILRVRGLKPDDLPPRAEGLTAEQIRIALEGPRPRQHGRNTAYKGVGQNHPDEPIFRAQVRVNLGEPRDYHFDVKCRSEEDAAIVADWYYYGLYGDNCYLNFPQYRDIYRTELD